ncbi:RING-H2 finger protein ATL56-like [Solanum dulcamara]|uniref:RING-H2 finger protein ATL56-like n=1 Tax=Solanum dulcamara TaxID=45834 RepID=UPI002485B4EF|nr:RING-H2 finger protein ATL56-like [Solanum dulcamara]
MVICYLVLDLIDQQQGDSNDDISRVDAAHDSGLSFEELQEISCFYLKGQKILSIQMSSSAPELPSPLFLVVIIVVYMVICYLVLDMIDQQVDSNDETSRMDAYDSGLSVEELQGISCFYLKEEANSSMCVICLDSLCEAELCRSFPPCNHVFHAQCLDPWLAKKTTCPTCRTPLRP